MIEKFSEAFSILRNNLGLFSAIILTVWLPGNILLNYFLYNVEGIHELAIIKYSLYIEGIFGPLYIGALVFSLYQIKSGRTVTYKEAMTVGVEKWGALFLARFIASIFVSIGFIALIIPGIVLMVRYSLLSAAVVLENMGPPESRARSAELTIGHRWQIFLTGILYFVFFIALTFAIYLPQDLIGSLNIMPVDIVLDCFLDIAFAIIQIVIFLFYWEAIHAKQQVEEIPEAGIDTVVPQQ